MKLLKSTELLNHDSVVQQLYPQVLAEKISPVTPTISDLNEKVETKERKIATLEEKMEQLEMCGFKQQYARYCNCRFHGITESGHGEDTTIKKALTPV